MIYIDHAHCHCFQNNDNVFKLHFIYEIYKNYNCNYNLNYYYYDYYYGYFEDLPEAQNSHCLVTCYIKTLVVTYGEMILYTLVCFQSYRIRSRKLYTK